MFRRFWVLVIFMLFVLAGEQRICMAGLGVQIRSVEWCSGYHICLTTCKVTKGPKFDPWFNHFFFPFCLSYHPIKHTNYIFKITSIQAFISSVCTTNRSGGRDSSDKG